MADYRYLLHDLRTNAVAAELPLVDVTYSPQQINTPGPFTAVVPALDLDLAAELDVIGATEPGRRMLYIERNGALVYDGILWTRRYTSADGHLALAGSEPSSYFSRRRWTPADRMYIGSGDRAIFVDLVNDAMSGAGAGLGITPVVPAGTGNFRNRHFVAADLEPIAARIDSLADEAPGFEYANEVRWVDDVPSRTVVLAAVRGRSAAATGLVWEYPGNVLSYEWPEDATTMANLIWGMGKAAATNLDLSSFAWNLDRMTLEGYPLLEDFLSLGDVANVAQLARHLTAELGRRDAPVILPTLTVSGAAFPAVGDYVVGDRFRLAIDDRRRFPTPLEGPFRVLTQSVTVARSGAEAVTLTVMPWPSLTT